MAGFRSKLKSIATQTSATTTTTTPTTTTTDHNPTAFRPRYMTGLYSTESSANSTTTVATVARDSNIVAHVNLRTGRDTYQDPAVEGSYGSRLLRSTSDLLQALRADEAPNKTSSSERSSDECVTNSAERIAELEEERITLLQQTNAAQRLANYAAEVDQLKEREHQAVLKENRKLHDQVNEYKDEAIGLQKYRLHAQKRIAELESAAQRTTNEIAGLDHRVQGYKKTIEDLTKTIVGATAQLQDNTGKKMVLREKNSDLEQELHKARAEIEKLRKGRWL